MRFFALILFCAVMFLSHAEPEPKKYKNEIKDKKTNSTLTEEERKFIREVEAKFGIKNDKDSKDEVTPKPKPSNATTEKMPFPAVIAIEIVNDTDTKTKGKRTIDANLGYGYKTNNGYMYSYFGKSGQDEGKFMIYPYSQEDIPAPSHQSLQHNIHFQTSGPKYNLGKTHVEIQPSRAYELVAVRDEKPSYQYKKPMPTYTSIKGLVSSTPTFSSHIEQTHNPIQLPKPTTLFTTYNGVGFSGLTNQFPTVMPNYFVDPSQLLNQPEYQGAGLTPDHLSTLHDSSVEQRVVPVLVLRIPSSSLKNPTAELFANLPNNYPLSRYLNNVNLQELVNEYFKKIGYPNTPSHVMTYKEGLPTRGASPSLSHFEPQHYAAPYVQPSYTHADYSGVQYSAVQPVMARYPSSYMRHHYMSSNGHSLFRHPMMHQQKYEYRYQHHPKHPSPTQTYYIHPQYHQQSHHVTAEQTENVHPVHNHDHRVQDAVPEPQVQYETPSHDFTISQTQTQTEEPTKSEHTGYTYGVKEESTATLAPEYEMSSVPATDYGSSKDNVQNQEYYNVQPVQKEAVSVYSHGEPSGRNYQSQSDSTAVTGYTYPKPGEEASENEDHPLSENYPSQDHTIATVLPVSYKNKISGSGAIQTVSYVTPMPYTSKFQSSFNVMVPQTFLFSPATEKVAYVHSVSPSFSPINHQDSNPEHEYTVSQHYVPPVSHQKPPPFPRNYHSHPKRMTRPEKRPDNMMHLNMKKINYKKEVKSS